MLARRARRLRQADAQPTTGPQDCARLHLASSSRPQASASAPWAHTSPPCRWRTAAARRAAARRLSASLSMRARPPTHGALLLNSGTAMPPLLSSERACCPHSAPGVPGAAAPGHPCGLLSRTQLLPECRTATIPATAVPMETVSEESTHGALELSSLPPVMHMTGSIGAKPSPLWPRADAHRTRRQTAHRAGSGHAQVACNMHRQPATCGERAHGATTLWPFAPRREPISGDTSGGFISALVGSISTGRCSSNRATSSPRFDTLFVIGIPARPRSAFRPLAGSGREVRRRQMGRAAWRKTPRPCT